ncbi:hypothetical protein T265_04170 [Opisthorchis viverrini]|uniref:Uncharacterized protein n=1 Tax=Opisthorchis viverrini TaxID=6198 RepID=A0A075A103_OPIVI|nr:hypothetical protein T265_04170 [Opisthorchis viverrini]KER29165.1 hypothetical protein T265_04170 [Opisthorchis viverrini]
MLKSEQLKMNCLRSTHLLYVVMFLTVLTAGIVQVKARPPQGEASLNEHDRELYDDDVEDYVPAFRRFMRLYKRGYFATQRLGR